MATSNVGARTGDVQRSRESFNTMVIKVNGQSREIAEGTTVGSLVAQLGVARNGIAVACNDDVIPRGAIDSTALQDGDAIEIIVAVAGG